MVNVTKTCVSGEGHGRKLNDRECAKKDQDQVEKERIHVGAIDLHGVQFNAQETDAHLEVAGNHTEEEVQAEECHRQDAEEWEPRVKLDEVFVQELRLGREEEHEDDDVQRPHERQDGRQDPHQQQEDRPQRVVVPHVLGRTEVVIIILQKVDHLLELVDCITLAPFCRGARQEISTFRTTLLSFRLDKMPHFHQIAYPRLQQKLLVGELFSRQGLGSSGEGGDEIHRQGGEPDATECLHRTQRV